MCLINDPGPVFFFRKMSRLVVYCALSRISVSSIYRLTFVYNKICPSHYYISVNPVCSPNALCNEVSDWPIKAPNL